MSPSITTKKIDDLAAVHHGHVVDLILRIYSPRFVLKQTGYPQSYEPCLTRKWSAVTSYRYNGSAFVVRLWVYDIDVTETAFDLVDQIDQVS